MSSTTMTAPVSNSAPQTTEIGLPLTLPSYKKMDGRIQFSELFYQWMPSGNYSINFSGNHNAQVRLNITRSKKWEETNFVQLQVTTSDKICIFKLQEKAGNSSMEWGRVIKNYPNTNFMVRYALDLIWIFSDKVEKEINITKRVVDEGDESYFTILLDALTDSMNKTGLFSQTKTNGKLLSFADLIESIEAVDGGKLTINNKK